MNKFKIGDIISSEHKKDRGVIINYNEYDAYDVYWFDMGYIFNNHSEEFISKYYTVITNSKLAIHLYG